MATSSITANFAIRDEKEAKAFISALLSESRSMVPPARKRNWKLVSSAPEDYTTWHQRHFDNGESVRELGEKIKKFAAAKRQNATA